MKYHGKRYLYNFLKEHGCDVPIMKHMRYEFYRGTEWLKTAFNEIYVNSPTRGVIFVILNEIDDETDEKKQVEYSKYVNGVLTYQEMNGKLTIIDGKPYVKITA